METFGTVMVIMLAVLPLVAGLVIGVGFVLMKIKASLITQLVLPEVYERMDRCTEEVLDKTMKAMKRYVKELEED